jgi:hypothetical protein
MVMDNSGNHHGGNRMKLQVDTINGIYVVQDLADYNAPSIVTGDVFINCLFDMADGDEMAADLSFRQVRTIFRHGYAIQRRWKP